MMNKLFGVGMGLLMSVLSAQAMENKQDLLLHAIESNNPEKITQLFNQGASLDFKYTVNTIKTVPLIIAAQKGHYDSVNALLSCCKSSSYKFNALNQVDSNGFNALHQACYNGHTRVVELLINAGADMNAHNRKWDLTPLMLAVLTNKFCVVEMLLDKGARIDERTSDGKMALHFAAMTANRPITWLLIANNSTLNAQTYEKKQTPLHCALLMIKEQNIYISGKKIPVNISKDQVADYVESFITASMEHSTMSLDKTLADHQGRTLPLVLQYCYKDYKSTDWYKKLYLLLDN